MNTLQQQLPKRFTDAVSKLYNAFHENRLDAMDECACAVGNICDNSGEWRLYARYDTSFYEIMINRRDLPKNISKFGYSKLELATIEETFLLCGKNLELKSKESQFKGLCAVIKYLCELDNIPNIMDFTSLFETENDKPVKELQFV